MPDDRRKLADELFQFREAYDQAARDGTLTAFLAEHYERQAATLRGVAERQLNELVELEAERDRLRAAVEEFVDKHFHGGPKANRPDYVTNVPTADVYALRAALRNGS